MKEHGFKGLFSLFVCFIFFLVSCIENDSSSKNSNSALGKSSPIDETRGQFSRIRGSISFHPKKEGFVYFVDREIGFVVYDLQTHVHYKVSMPDSVNTTSIVNPSWSTDGNYIAYWGPDNNIYIFDILKNEIKKIVVGMEGYYPVIWGILWNGDEGFFYTAPDKDSERNEINYVSVPSLEIKEIFKGDGAGYEAQYYSKGSDTLFFSHGEDIMEQPKLYKKKALFSNLNEDPIEIKLNDSHISRDLGAPYESFSHDGSYVVFSGNGNNERLNLFIGNFKTGKVVNILSDEHDNYSSEFNFNLSQLVFLTNWGDGNRRVATDIRTMRLSQEILK